MSLVDEISGSLSVLIRLLVSRSNPQGRDVYQLSYNAAWGNTEATGDDTAFRLRGAFHEIITVTTVQTVLSLADSVDPMGAQGSNVPSADPEGAELKILALHNMSPADGTGQGIQVDVGTDLNELSGFLINPGADTRFIVQPGGLALFVGPQALAANMNDGVDDEIGVSVLGETADLEVLYAFA